MQHSQNEVRLEEELNDKQQTPSTSETKHVNLEKGLETAINPVRNTDKNWRQNRVSRTLYDSCECYKDNQYHRIVSLHSEAQSSCASDVGSSLASVNS